MEKDGKDHGYQIIWRFFPLLCARKETEGHMTNMLLQYAM